MKPARVLSVVFCCVLFSSTATAAELVANAEFTVGDQAPAGWKLVGPDGRWVDKNFLEVTGNPHGSSYWRTDALELKPGGLYRFEFRARGSIGGGCVISGPDFANRDYHALSNDWKWYGHVFRAPEKTTGAYLRLGLWEADGKVQFDSVRLVPAIPVHVQSGDVVLGEGETIRDGRYQFQGTFDGEGSNYHRVLDSATAGFNSNRWCFGGDGQVTYKFAVPGHKFMDGRASFSLTYHTHGSCTAEVSTDGQTWRPIATQDKLGAGDGELPSDMLPAATIWLRLRASSPANFQVDRVELDAGLDGTVADNQGEEHFAVVECPSEDLAVDRLVWKEDRIAKKLWLTVHQSGTGEIGAKLLGYIETADGARTVLKEGFAQLDAARPASYRIDCPATMPGRNRIVLRIEADTLDPLKLTVGFEVPEFYRADYGQRLAGREDVWWCDATHKIPRSRPVPAEEGQAARLSACRNDREAVQIVVRPDKPLTGLTATTGPLTGPDGATIPAENVKILRVYYHYVHTPTDKTGVRDWWPDALPPLDEPIDVAAGQNQPLWVLVHVPADAKAGDYEGSVSLKSGDWSARVPIKLHVWDFALPDRNHLETAFGLSPGTIFQYHGLKTEADKRKVLDLYFQSFAEHRISPYDPTPLDPIRVKWLPEADPPRAEVDFSAFDPAMQQAVQKYHFNGFQLHVQGMGGGTFHERWEPKIGDHGERTPQYQAMFSSYVGQLEEHLRAKGWLEMAYIYWFDEPDPKDYQFVTDGFERLKRYGPGLRRMLTEQPGDELKAPVDIWCPVSFNYNDEQAAKKKAQGCSFWWYVCCGPKAPYCTLFIDHPATELRVWHWQTWQRGIAGTLVWSSNYWTSSAAYPNEPQNPYEDPMGYVSGYSTPKGVKRFWGNGDGRFLYPPLAAALPGKSGPEPVLAGPVSSIRWEMLREGVEDYEYLYLLRELIAKHRTELPAEELKRYESLLEVPESITRDMTTFTADPAPIYARRAAVAEAIERLSAR